MGPGYLLNHLSSMGLAHPLMLVEVAYCKTLHPRNLDWWDPGEDPFLPGHLSFEISCHRR